MGMLIGTGLGWSETGTIALAVTLAFLFGYALTMRPLLQEMSWREAGRIALVADTLSITVMEIVDNAIMLWIPGAMSSGIDNPLFWGGLAFALFIAYWAAVPVNSWMITRGMKAHCHH